MPFPAKIKSSTGTAPIVKAGHTASDKHGTDPEERGSVPQVRDLSISTTGKK